MVVSSCAMPWTKIPVPKQAFATSGHVDIGPVKLAYWDTGGPGEVVVLNHPNCQGSACWALPAAGACSRRLSRHRMVTPRHGHNGARAAE